MLPIVDPMILTAAERFEAETGRRLADELPTDADEAMLALYLIMNGYQPERFTTDDPEKRR